MTGLLRAVRAADPYKGYPNQRWPIMALRQVISYVDDDMAPGSEPAAEAPPPGYDEWLIHFEYFLANDPRGQALLGGGGEPEGELGEPMEPAMPEPGEQNSAMGKAIHTHGRLDKDASLLSRAGSVGRAMVPGARAVGTANQLRKGNIGAAAGEFTGLRPLSKAAGYQNGQAPTAYQAELSSLKKTVSQLVARDKQQQDIIESLAGNNAVKDAELQVSYLAQQGVVALYNADRTAIDPKKFGNFVNDLAAMPEQHRHAKVNEIALYWEKDDAIAYAASGAPVGRSMVGVAQSQMNGTPPGDSPAGISEAQLEKVVAYQRTNPKDSFETAKQKVLGKK